MSVDERHGNERDDVSWDDAQVFCQRLAANDGKKYWLLTETEWEYACRAGTTTKYHFGESASTLGTYAWFDDNTSKVGEQYAHVVGQKQANPFGLYDMHGNVLEWCADWYSAPLACGSDPAGPSHGSLRVGRGRSWFFTASVCRSAHRIGVSPSIGQDSLGFRVAAGTSGT